MVSRGGGAVPAVPAAPLRPGRDMAPRGRPDAAAMPRRGGRKRLKFRADDVCSERGKGRAGPGRGNGLRPKGSGPGAGSTLPGEDGLGWRRGGAGPGPTLRSEVKRLCPGGGGLAEQGGGRDGPVSVPARACGQRAAGRAGPLWQRAVLGGEGGIGSRRVSQAAARLEVRRAQEFGAS